MVEEARDELTTEWDKWSYVPTVGVGPFRFGMTVDKVVEAAEILGQATVSECARQYKVFSLTWKIEVRRPRAASGAPAVTAYVSQAVGLFCIAADAANGPQVEYANIPLVGRELPELEADMIAYAEAEDVYFLYSTAGIAGPDDHGVVMCGQLVGQSLRSRPLFMVARDGANTEWDSLPSEEYRNGQFYV